MKRRKFIQAALITGATLPVATIAGGTRLYGEPASVRVGGVTAEKFKLPLARAGIPSAMVPSLASVATVIEEVLTSPSEASKFAANPRAYMLAHGLDASDKTLLDDTVVVITTLGHPAVQDCLLKRDYDSLYQYLEAAGLFERRDPAKLETQLERILSDNLSEIRERIAGRGRPLDASQRNALNGLLKDSGLIATEDDLAILGHVFSDGGATIQSCTAIAMCLVAVGIAAALAIYVSVAIGLTVGIMAGVFISVAVDVAITVTVVDIMSEDKARGLSAPFTGKFARLDPELTRNADRAFRIAALTGDRELHLHALRKLIRTEVDAVLGAMRRTGLLQLSDEHFVASKEATALYAYKALGIPSES